ncbi:hypothetical protein Pmar_PMAR003428 [Perkinsus marinus ATCC 50983]|uniref:Uncharacterized protein n=1 Tax=Perkinsus marinus (strain ATCC 50983 / TXsc) TaxID=423536 RepID=C5KHA7_PERM5|nr:hypothetical protein Pmar_PMAR003428 [Perkinsus marinus ATCC 50983]EER15969.1 hypothetical protein Pmar_PMAR003428 [Perkinsus marinus ATCC 50983]|eukprot:XP_002784173.1 hypothetical protein Pmar_PMAR003428 [Perkinsus marinus ATCC 50983]
MLSVIGLIASMVGIGGGLLMNPLVLSLGLDPKQSTATTAIVIFATSTSGTITVISGIISLVHDADFFIFFRYICFAHL